MDTDQKPLPPTPVRRTLGGWRTYLPSARILTLIAVLALFTLLLYRNDKLHLFVGKRNLQTILHGNCVTAVAALGMLLVIVSGGIDLSAGSVVALVTVVAVQVYRMVYVGPQVVFPESVVQALDRWGVLWNGTESALAASTWAVVGGLGVGCLCGLVNGLMVARLRVAPFVATLGMMSVARGLAFGLANRLRIPIPGELPEWMRAIQRTDSRLLVDPGVWSALALAAVVAVVLSYTSFGRYCYAIGSNEATARLCGVNVDRQKLVIYGLAGLLTAWAGVLLFAQNSCGDPNSSVGFELDVIAAVVIGGASLSGGQGTVGGTLLGVLFLGILVSAVNFFDADLGEKYILIGVIVVANVALSGWQRSRDIA